jgi:hypothetical protein
MSHYPTHRPPGDGGWLLPPPAWLTRASRRGHFCWVRNLRHQAARLLILVGDDPMGTNRHPSVWFEVDSSTIKEVP